jgi:hypothetical protein
VNRDARLAALIVIDGRRRLLRVSMLGQALAVSGDALPSVLHPIARIDRAVVLGDVAIEAAALRALADADCPLAIADGDGRVRAVVRAMGRRRTTIADALDRFAQRPDWAGRLEDWQRARIARLARGIAPDPAAAARLGPAAAESVLRAAVPASRARAMRLAAEARSFTQLAALAALARAGVPDRWTGGGGDPARNLTPAFGTIAFWHLLALLRRPGWAPALAHAYAEDGRAGAGGAAAATLAVLRPAERPLRAALADEARLLFAWLLDLTAPGAIPEDGFAWPG